MNNYSKGGAHDERPLFKSSIALLLLPLLALAADYAGTNANPNAILTPYGPWALCEGSNPPQGLCAGFRPGQESYMLLLRAQSPNTIMFHYVVTGTRADGQILRVEGAALRQDFNGITTVIVGLGAPIADAQVVVEER